MLRIRSIIHPISINSLSAHNEIWAPLNLSLWVKVVLGHILDKLAVYPRVIYKLKKKQ